MKKAYTYVNFANDCINLINGFDISVSKEEFLEKAQALLATQEHKSNYQSSKTSKGVGEKTQRTIDLLEKVLDSTPKTTAEINEILGVELNALQISGAVKHMDGVQTTKVKRRVIDSKGLKCERLYTAYFIGEMTEE